MDGLTQIQAIITFAWWIALSLSVVLYVILDGADLGAGVFSLFVRNPHERGAIMSAMAGTWDANETWLIVAGGVLFATFPFVYGSAFNYLMVPLALALWGMITRAVALEFRHLADAHWQRFSDFAFGFSSLVVAFFGGMALGAVMQGFPLTHEPGTVPTYVGGALRFISPFSIWTGISSVIAVTLGGVEVAESHPDRRLDGVSRLSVVGKRSPEPERRDLTAAVVQGEFALTQVLIRCHRLRPPYLFEPLVTLAASAANLASSSSAAASSSGLFSTTISDDGLT